MTRKDAYAVLTLAVLPFLFLSPTLHTARTYFARDLTYLFHPWRVLSAQMIQSGSFPLWNPYEMGGMPFLANCQSAILYPFSLFFSFLEFLWALKAFHGIHYFLAGLGFYLFLRKLDLSRPSALLGAVLFGFNGYSLTRLEFLSILGSLIWLPWILLFALPAEPMPKSVGSVLAGLALALSFFAGFTQVLLLQIGAAAVFAALLLKARWGTLWLLGAGATLLILGAAQWMPTVELLRRSIRGGAGVAFDEATIYSLPPQGIWGLIFPYWIPHHPDRFLGEKFFWIWSGWWGIVATLLLVPGCIHLRRRLALFCGILFLGGIGWALGIHAPLYGLFYRALSFVRLFRYPPVALYWTVAGCAILAAAGSERIRRSAWTRRLKWAAALFWLIAGAELWIYSRRHLPTTLPVYYTVSFNAIRTLQKEKPGTVILSPKIDSERWLAGINDFQAKLKFRTYLFDLTNLPYRIRTIIPSGEPLALKNFEIMRARLAQGRSLAAVKPLFDLWNVTHLLSYEENVGGWESVARHQDFKIYRNPDAMGEVFAMPKDAGPRVSPTLPEKIESEPARMRFEISLKKDSIVATHLPDYPGWKVFETGNAPPPRRIPILNLDGLFLGFERPAGRHSIVVRYSPKSWFLGLIVTLGGILFLAVSGARSARRRAAPAISAG